jgi:CheY-like chemotaxis protein
LLLVILDMTTLRSLPSSPARRPSLAVIDADASSWSTVEVGCHRTTTVPPAGVRAQDLAATTPVRTIVNLAAPGALDAVAALRAGGYPRRFWGCIAHPTSPMALGLGMVEVMPRSFDTTALFDRLRGWVPRGAKVVAVGNRPEAFMPLRTALTREGFSVSLAWDAGQANDLLDMVDADLVILDLGMPHGAHAVLAKLAQRTTVPNVVLLPGRGDDAAAFAATLRSGKIIAKTRTRHDVLETFLHEGESAARQTSRIQGTVGAPSLQHFSMTA